MYTLGSVITSAEIPVLPNTLVTLLQVVAHTQKSLHIHKWGVYPSTKSVEQDPVSINLVQHSSAGTQARTHRFATVSPAGASVWAVPLMEFSSYPNRGQIIDGAETHPQAGWEVTYPLGFEPEVGPGGRMGIDIFVVNSMMVRPKIWISE